MFNYKNILKNLLLDSWKEFIMKKLNVLEWNIRAAASIGWDNDYEIQNWLVDKVTNNNYDVIILNEFVIAKGWDNCQNQLKQAGYVWFMTYTSYENGILIALKKDTFNIECRDDVHITKQICNEKDSCIECPDFLAVTVTYANIPLTIIGTRIKVLIGSNDFDELEVSIEGNYENFEFSGFEFIIYDDIDKAKDDAVEDAINIEKETLEGLKNELSQKYLSSTESENIRKRFHSFIDNIRNNCGNDGFDEDELKGVFEESFEFDYDNLDEEDAIDVLLRWEIIEDTEEYFDLDEDGEIDHTLPKFDYQDYKDKYVEKSMEDLGDFVDEYVLRFGYDSIEEYIDFDKVGEMYVDIDGPAQWLAYYDSVEREQRIDDVIYYIYRRQ